MQLMWLRNAKVPASLVVPLTAPLPDREGFLCLDLSVSQGRIQALFPSPSTPEIQPQDWDLEGRILLPCFVDIHTHLDKAHTWERTPNRDGSFRGALEAVESDRRHWQAPDLATRMEFALRCGYAHGTQAMRTHLDVPPHQIDISVEVFQQIQSQWNDRMQLQAVSLVTLDDWMGDYGVQVADTFAQFGGLLGGVAYQNPDLDIQLDRVLGLAKERQLSLDFHVDETGDPGSQCLRAVAEAVLRHDFPYAVTCGHCCSLALQPPAEAQATIDRVKAAGIHIVSLPLCNAYLQDRHPHRTPRWRGIPPLQELRGAGIPLSIGHDNCRDPFYAFGDHDLLQIFALSVLLGHLDAPDLPWITAITATPAQAMGLSSGILAPQGSADFIVFHARHYSELLSRPHPDRQVVRQGKLIDTTLPPYSALTDGFTGEH